MRIGMKKGSILLTLYIYSLVAAFYIIIHGLGTKFDEKIKHTSFSKAKPLRYFILLKNSSLDTETRLWRKKNTTLEMFKIDVQIPVNNPRLSLSDVNSDECYYADFWQGTSFPTCSEIHSIDLRRDVKYIAHGGRRDVWNLPNNFSSTDKVVLKTLRFNGSKDELVKFPQMIEAHRIDALIMERLTGSSRIANIFGYCGNSALNELGHNTLYKYVANNDPNLSDKDRLNLAIEAAMALSEVHNFVSESGETLIVHGDIRPWNYLINDSEQSLLLNDFNAALLIKKNRTSSSRCNLSRRGCALNQSPEECLRLPTRNEKIDIYAFGHVLFYLIAGTKPYDNITINSNWTRNSFEQGNRPYSLSETIMKRGQASPYIRALSVALDKCYTLDPNLRPSSNEIVQLLQRAYLNLESH